jgi:L,D-transpeptidase YcbB
MIPKKNNNYFVQFQTLNRSLFLVMLLVFGIVSCRQSSKKDESETTETKTASGPNLVSATDSVFVVRYVTEKQPAFKKHLDLMKTFYRDRSFRLAWFKDNGLLPQANQLQEEINHAAEEALNPKDYQSINFPNLISQYEKTKDDSVKARLQEEIDVALTATDV